MGFQNEIRKMSGIGIGDTAGKVKGIGCFYYKFRNKEDMQRLQRRKEWKSNIILQSYGM